MSLVAQQYLRAAQMPHIWCPGCGHGIVTQAVLKAIDQCGLDRDKVVVVSGIGCSSRAPGYLDFDTLHTTHGRALAFATGIKHANPDLHVIVVTGDGDATAIGGNHLIHAARRNIDITTVVYNNSIYGMTSGQFSPLTPKGRFATTAPFGNIDREFNLCGLVTAAGATYVARSTAYHANHLKDMIVAGIKNKGFSLIEAISNCPTYYGRKNKLGGPVEMLSWQKDHAVMAKAAEKMSPEQMVDKFVIGELFSQPAPEYTEEYAKIVQQVRGRA